MSLRARYIHNTLFLISRAALLLSLFVPWALLRKVSSVLLSLCAIHQLFFYCNRRRAIDERQTNRRASQSRIRHSNGPVGKTLAAIEVFLWGFSSRRNPINLLHWLELAIGVILYMELFKLESALTMQLQFEWSHQLCTLLCIPLRNPDKPLLAEKYIESAKEFIVHKIFKSRSDLVENLDAFHTSPSFTVWALWLFCGRPALAWLQDDPRERAYHMDSAATHRERLRVAKTGNCTSPLAFGVDMAHEFQRGISRNISVDELDSTVLLTVLEEEDIDQLMRKDEDTIDHDAVYCISYRHLSDRNRESAAIFQAFSIAAMIARGRNRTHFRVWMDKILRRTSHRPPERWAFHGLLPYAYYPVIAVRGMTEDEGDRMWLLAEERLGYGNSGLFWFDMETMDLRYIPGVNSGPANSIRIYLRYLKTGEGVEEQTFHEEDRRRFVQMANDHGITDDEQEIYERLSGKCSRRRMRGISEVWWHCILDVESYAPLRRQNVNVEEIQYPKADNVPFDGYREWFKFNDVRAIPSSQEYSASLSHGNGATWGAVLSHKLTNFSAHVIADNCKVFVVLIYRDNTGVLRRAACICVLVEVVKNCLKPRRVFRLQLKYSAPPPDEDFIDAAKNIFFSATDCTAVLLKSLHDIRLA